MEKTNPSKMVGLKKGVLQRSMENINPTKVVVGSKGLLQSSKENINPSRLVGDPEGVLQSSMKNTNPSKMVGRPKVVLQRSGVQKSSSSRDVHEKSNLSLSPVNLFIRSKLLSNCEMRKSFLFTKQCNPSPPLLSPHVGVPDSSDTVSNQNEEYISEYEHEVDSLQTKTNPSDHQQEENVGSTSHGTSVTRKESRALSETRKSNKNKGKLMFVVDECAGRIIGEDSQKFITKGGCVMCKHAKFDGTTWKNQPDLLKKDIIAKSTENSNFDPNSQLMEHAIQTQLANQHKNRQYRLHKYYNMFPTNEVAITNPSSGIKASDWVTFVKGLQVRLFRNCTVFQDT